MTVKAWITPLFFLSVEIFVNKRGRTGLRRREETRERIKARVLSVVCSVGAPIINEENSSGAQSSTTDSSCACRSVRVCAQTGFSYGNCSKRAKRGEQVRYERSRSRFTLAAFSTRQSAADMQNIQNLYHIQTLHPSLSALSGSILSAVFACLLCVLLSCPVINHPPAHPVDHALKINLI